MWHSTGAVRRIGKRWPSMRREKSDATSRATKNRARSRTYVLQLTSPYPSQFSHTSYLATSSIQQGRDWIEYVLLYKEEYPSIYSTLCLSIKSMTPNTQLKFEVQEYNVKCSSQALGKYSQKYSIIEYHLGMTSNTLLKFLSSKSKSMTSNTLLKHWISTLRNTWV